MESGSGSLPSECRSRCRDISRLNFRRYARSYCKQYALIVGDRQRRSRPHCGSAILRSQDPDSSMRGVRGSAMLWQASSRAGHSGARSSAPQRSRFSPEPNPRWVAYQSDETGRHEIFIASFPEPRRRIQITSGGGTYPQWGPDGRELFFISADGRLKVVGLKNGPEGMEPTAPRELFPLSGAFWGSRVCNCAGWKEDSGEPDHAGFCRARSHRELAGAVEEMSE